MARIDGAPVKIGGVAIGWVVSTHLERDCLKVVIHIGDEEARKIVGGAIAAGRIGLTDADAAR